MMAEGKIKMTPLVEIHDGVMEFPGEKKLRSQHITSENPKKGVLQLYIKSLL